MLILSFKPTYSHIYPLAKRLKPNWFWTRHAVANNIHKKSVIVLSDFSILASMDSVLKSMNYLGVIPYLRYVRSAVRYHRRAVRSVQCSERSVQHSVRSVQCTLRSVQCSERSVQCSVRSVQCSVRSVQCSVRSVESAVKFVQRSVGRLLN